MNAQTQTYQTLGAAMAVLLVNLPQSANYNSILPPHARGPFRVWGESGHGWIEQRTERGHWQLVAEWNSKN